MHNPLSNAFKYRSPDRDCQIRVRTENMGGYILLSVKDNGPGLNEKNKKQLFPMFKRFHAHTEGTGIGLCIVKRIMDNAGAASRWKVRKRKDRSSKCFSIRTRLRTKDRAGRPIVIRLIVIIVILSTHCQPVTLYHHALAPTDSDGNHGCADYTAPSMD